MNASHEILVAVELAADAEALMDSIASGKPLSPCVARRIRERAEALRQDILDTHGILDIGVPAIREIRDGDAA